MKKIFAKILRAILRMEHIIYCATYCHVELPFHKWYYAKTRKEYDKYIDFKYL